MVSTQKEILEESFQRNLTKGKQNVLIKERLKQSSDKNDPAICSQCQSRKIIITREAKADYTWSNRVRYYNYYECGVCGQRRIKE